MLFTTTSQFSIATLLSSIFILAHLASRNWSQLHFTFLFVFSRQTRATIEYGI
ncbi:hypothetical protein TSUD_118450 [Trifolium subterraneum]|uniref:Uncharacterized protein n=1 Tax=Trifolium subterraneum TaxID=3900 RepID=A0A2Z6M9L2_TRISU|nr:hypothetical protein TSUD_118450 [Trifolium subterraneum]